MTASLTVDVNQNDNRLLIAIVNFNSCRYRVSTFSWNSTVWYDAIDPETTGFLIKDVYDGACSSTNDGFTRSVAVYLPAPTVGTSNTLSVTVACRSSAGYTCDDGGSPPTPIYPQLSLAATVLFNASQAGSYGQNSYYQTWNGSPGLTTYPGSSSSCGLNEKWVSSFAINGDQGDFRATTFGFPPPPPTQPFDWSERTGFGSTNLVSLGGTVACNYSETGNFSLGSFDPAMTEAGVTVSNGCLSSTPPCTPNTGSNSFTYRVVARYSDGDRSEGQDAVIPNSVAVLGSPGDTNLITWTAVSRPGSTVTYDIYRTANDAGYSTGLIASGVTGTSYDDTGGTASGSIPVFNYVIQLIGIKPAKTTAVTGIEFEALPHRVGTLLRWRTAGEIANLGFNIFREDDGVTSKVNASLIGGSVFLVGPNTSLSQGRAYQWKDPRPAGPTTRYWLEAIDLNGTTDRFESEVVFATPESEAAAVEYSRASLLDELGQQSLVVTEGLSGIAAGFGEAELTPDVDDLAVAGAAALPTQREIAAGQAVKLSVSREGWYRVTNAQLAAAGFNPTATRNLQLYSDGVEQAMVVTGDSDPRSASFVLEFHGRPLDTPYTATRTYWLVDGKKAGLRFARQAPTRATATTPSSFPFTVERKDRTIYFTALVNNGDASNFFGPVVSQTPITQTLVLNKLDSKAPGAWPLQVALQGVTLDASHSVEVRVNGNVAGSVTFRNQDRGTATLQVPRSWLVEGPNAIELTAFGGATDVSLVDSIRLTYPHRYEAESGVLKFVAQAGAEISLEGADPATRIVDVTDSRAGVELLVSQTPGSSVARAVVPGGLGFSKHQRTLLAFGATRPLAPEQVTQNVPSSWTTDRSRADLTILTHSAFVPAARKLQGWRQAQGLSVRVVDVEDLYDELSFGAKDPTAIRSYLASSFSKYALLFGDASADPRNYLGLGSWDFLPAKVVPTTYIKAASDDWYVDPNGKGTVTIPIGRIAVRTAPEATAAVDKLIALDSARAGNAGDVGWLQRVVHVADADDPNLAPYSFVSEVARLGGLVPSTFTAKDLLVGQLGAAAARTSILSEMNTGALLFTFVGHGSQDRWSLSNVFNVTSAASLTGAPRVPVMVALNCLNGYFVDFFADSLAESVQKQSGGPAAIWASSGVSDPQGQMEMAKSFYGHAFKPGVRIGDAIKAAKADVKDPNVKTTWILFGDPTMIVR